MNGNSPIKITIEGKPATAGHTTGRGRWYKNLPAENYQAFVRMKAVEAMRNREIITGAVRMDVTIYRHVPKGFSKKKTVHALTELIFPITRPDRDNTLKLLQDGLNEIVYQDDSQIVAGDTKKRYAETDYVEIEITGMGWDD